MEYDFTWCRTCTQSSKRSISNYDCKEQYLWVGNEIKFMYKTGEWGSQARLRSKNRLEYFKKYLRDRYVRRFNGFGSIGESIALKILNGSQICRKPGYDVFWNKKKVEVKTSKEHVRLGKYRYWSLFISKKQKESDLLLFICMDSVGKYLKKIYLIPTDKLNKVGHISISVGSDLYKEYLLGVSKKYYERIFTKTKRSNTKNSKKGKRSGRSTKSRR